MLAIALLANTGYILAVAIAVSTVDITHHASHDSSYCSPGGIRTHKLLSLSQAHIPVLVRGHGAHTGT